MVSGRRSSARRTGASERGATLFVVVLVITLLTGIGLFTVHSSALLARAAGNERAALQTTYLAELGTLTALSAIGSDPQAYIDLANEKKEDCRSTLGVNTSLYGVQKCIEMPDTKMVPPTGATLWGTDSFGTAIDASTGAYATTGKLDTETSDIEDTREIIPGFPPDKYTFMKAKITTTATLQPVEAATACVENVMQTAGQHMTRAHVKIGPVRKEGP